MANIEDLKGKFKNGMTPDENDYGELIDFADKNVSVLPKTIRSADLIDNSVRVEHMDFISKNKNLLDVSDENMIHGKAITATGDMIVSSTVSTTKNFIAVEPNTDYYKNFIGGVYQVDENFNRTQYLPYSSTEGAFRTHEQTRFLKVSLPKHRLNDAQLEKGTTGTSYVKGENVIEKRFIKIDNNNIEKETITTDKFSGLNSSRNKLDMDRLTAAYVSSGSGTITQNSGNSLSHKIPIESEQNITISGEFENGNTNVAFFNDSGTFISGEQIRNVPTGRYETTLETPTNSSYMLVSFHRLSYNVQVEDGTTASPYVKYHKYFEDLVDPRSGNNGGGGSALTKENTLKVTAPNDVIFKFPLSSNKQGSFRYSNSSTGDDFMKGRESNIYDGNGVKLFSVTNENSNKEFAIRVFDDNDENDQWFPEHNQISTAFVGNKGFIKLIADGDEVDLSEASQDIKFSKAQLIQKVECKLPTDTSTRAIITFISEIDGNKNKNKVKIEWLRKSKVSSGYIFMTPMNTTEFVDTLLAEDFTQIQSRPDATEQESTGIDNLDNKEFSFTSNRDGKTDIVFKTKVLKQTEDIKRIMFQHRTGFIEKLYLYHYDQTRKSPGDIDYFEGEYSIELMPRANEIFTND